LRTTIALSRRTVYPMETMTEPGTLKRIDERSDRIEGDVRDVKGDVREVRAEIRELRSETKIGFETLDAKFDAKFDRLNRTIVYLLGGSLSVLAGALVAAVLHAFI